MRYRWVTKNGGGKSISNAGQGNFGHISAGWSN